MNRIDLLLFRSDGQKMHINLRPLLTKLISRQSEFSRIKYDEHSNTLLYSDQNLDLTFPKEGNRFSVSIDPTAIFELIEEVRRIYEDQNLLLSTPGYETSIDAFSSNDAISALFGLP